MIGPLNRNILYFCLSFEVLVPTYPSYQCANLLRMLVQMIGEELN